MSSIILINSYKFNKIPPFASDAAFRLNGDIIIKSGSYYFADQSGNNKDILITDYDFDTTLDRGFPYKSAATISAPVGDVDLIAADVNNFLYDSGGTPNQIPVVSLFQNIDYADKLFCRHAPQSVDINGVETYEPRVLDIVLYNTVKTGNDLTVCNSYYGVPTKLTSGIREVGVGKTYSTIQLAINAALDTDTIYVYSGAYTLNAGVTKSINIIGLGLVSITTGAAFYLNSTSILTVDFTGIRFRGNDVQQLFGINASNVDTEVTYNKCYIDNKTAVQTTAATAYKTFINNSYVYGFIYVAKPCNLDTVLIKGNSLNSGLRNIQCSSATLQAKNVKRVFGYVGEPSEMVFIAVASDVEIIGGKIENEIILTTVANAGKNIKVKYVKAIKNQAAIPNYIDLNHASLAANVEIIGNDLDGGYFLVRNHTSIKINKNRLNLANKLTEISNATTPISIEFNENNITGNVDSQIYMVNQYGQFHNNILDHSFDFRLQIDNSVTNYNEFSIKYNKFYLKYLLSSETYIYNSTITNPFSQITIEDNEFYMPRYYGAVSNGEHLLLSYGSIVKASLNKIYGCKIGFVCKAAAESSAIKYFEVNNNLFTECFQPVFERQIPYTRVHHNRIINKLSVLDHAGYYDENADLGGTVPSENCQFTYNQMSCIAGGFLFKFFDTSRNGFISNNNQIYGDLKVLLEDTSEKTLTEWVALGYDTNSTFTDPFPGENPLEPLPI